MREGWTEGFRGGAQYREARTNGEEWALTPPPWTRHLPFPMAPFPRASEPMAQQRPFRWSPRYLLGLLPLLVLGCGNDPVGADSSLEPLVGDWVAQRFVVRNLSNPDQAPDLVGDPAIGATFTLSIEPSGLYQAVLVYQETPTAELGTLEVDGAEIVFHINVPQPPTTSRSHYILSNGRLTLVGDTQFDFDLDGNAEDAEATIELVRG